MKNPTQKELASFYKGRAKQYEEMLEFVRRKCKTDADMEFALRKVLRSYVRTKNAPRPGTKEYMEIHGIPFGDEDDD